MSGLGFECNKSHSVFSDIYTQSPIITQTSVPLLQKGETQLPSSYTDLKTHTQEDVVHVFGFHITIFYLDYMFLCHCSAVPYGICAVYLRQPSQLKAP